MVLYIVSYDLKKPDRDYTGLYNAIKEFGIWWRYLESTWIIKTTESHDKIFEKLRPHIDEDDNLLIIEAGKNYQGWLPQKAWDWIKENEKI